MMKIILEFRGKVRLHKDFGPNIEGPLPFVGSFWSTANLKMSLSVTMKASTFLLKVLDKALITKMYSLCY